MDTIAAHLRNVCRKVAVPRSVPGLVTPRLLVMEFMQGQPLLQVRAWGQQLLRLAWVAVPHVMRTCLQQPDLHTCMAA
jgi:hypothetical protein